ncbi:hypothetical protein N665_1606s0002 [Sinapis alba]|nr:hypothetical protein N665_1606s0002 [Sinapis alba]
MDSYSQSSSFLNLLNKNVVFIGAWLNTSKDHVVGNEQKTITFWKQIVTYFASSHKLAGLQKRESSHCKQRKNENDVMKMAHEIYFNDYKVKFTPSMHAKERMNKPMHVGVKASKAKGKRYVSEPTTLEEEGEPLDFVLKDKLNKQKLLDSLIAKTEPFSELEIALKNKLINDMLAS